MGELVFDFEKVIEVLFLCSKASQSLNPRIRN